MNKQQTLFVFKPDHTVTLLGGKGQGKTNLASVIIERLVEYGYTIFTNIHFFDFDDIGEACNIGKLKSMVDYKKKPDEVHVVTTLSELMLGLCQKGKKIVILDEAGINVASGVTKQTTTIQQLTYILRHFNACILFIAQTKGSLPPAIREKLVDFELTVHKKPFYFFTLGKREIAQDDYGNEYINFPFTDDMRWRIPPSKYPYDGLFPSGFEADLNLKIALAKLSELKSSMEVESQKGIDVIKRLIEDVPIVISKKDCIIDGLKQGLPAKEIKNKCNCALDTVYKYKRM